MLAAAPPAPVERAGDPDHPVTFITVKEDEQKMAGYLGFTHTTQFRQLCLTWPVILAFLAFEAHASNIRKQQVLELTFRWRECEQVIVQMNLDGWLQFTTNFINSSEGSRYNESTVLAVWIILRFENDLRIYAASDAPFNTGESESCLALLAETLGRDVPSRCLGLPMPNLGPLPGEHRLESINRCYNLLRWLTTIEQRNEVRGIWTSKLGSEGAVMGGRQVPPKKVPVWMQSLPGPEGTNTAALATEAQMLLDLTSSVL